MGLLAETICSTVGDWGLAGMLLLSGAAMTAWLGSVHDLFERARRRPAKALKPGDVRCCVITGAASGIGKATVFRMEDLGWHVLAADFNEKLLRELDAQTSDRVTTVVCDVSCIESCEALQRKAVELAFKIGARGIGALANVAGVMQLCPAASVSDEALRRALAVNCEAPVRLTRLLMPSLLRATSPRICNVASITGELSFPWSGCYSATKGFIARYSDSLRREARANNLPLRVSVVEPGFIDTPMTSRLPEQQLAWCHEHESDPMMPAMCASAARNDVIMKQKRLPGKFGELLFAIMGDPQRPMRNPPEDVADDIVHALCADEPLQRYWTMTLMFRAIIAFSFMLPPSLRDIFLVTLL